MKRPWYVRRQKQTDPFASKHSGGKQPKQHSAAERRRKRKAARVARANNWGRS